ncbi:MAG: ribosomal protein L13e [Candidatus Bathyarchaeota archaeon]|nr:ribosomal protein L13e [Candidatus Bathyarchaeota archaeon]
MHHIKPIIISPGGKPRLGKGFSPKEITAAGLTAVDARQMGIPIDWKRKSCHQDNTDALKAHIKRDSDISDDKP